MNVALRPSLWGIAALLSGMLPVTPLWGQPVLVPEPGVVPRISGPLVTAVALEGDRVSVGFMQSIGHGQIDRHGDVAFSATVALGMTRREGLFVWSGGVPKPLVLEGQPTGHGALLALDGFGDWAWNDGEQAVFLAAADSNGNGRYDPGVDPAYLFLASPGRLTPLLRIGDRVDGGALLEIRSFRLNGSGQVAFQARIDRNANGTFDPGVDTSGLYLLSPDGIHALVREGDRVQNGIVREIDTSTPLDWQLNNLGQVALEAGLEPASRPAFVHQALYLVDGAGIRVVAFASLRTSLGTLSQLGSVALTDSGEIAFSGALGQGLEPPIGLFRARTSRPFSPLEAVVAPGAFGPTGTPIGDLFPTAPAAAVGAIGFCGFYDQPSFGIDGLVSDPAACFILAPEFLYEVVREGERTPWGQAATFDALRLNSHTQAAVQIEVVTFPFIDTASDRGLAILFWQNGSRTAVVGPGDEIPGGIVGLESSLTGLSDSGRLAFESTVTDTTGSSRRGLFVVEVSGGRA